MNEHDPIRESSVRQREAEFWYRRLEDPDLQDHEWRGFLKWQAIPANQEAFDATAAERERMFLARQQSSSRTFGSHPRGLSRKLLTVAAALLLHAPFFMAVQIHESPPSVLQVFETADQPAGWQLADGSLLRAEPNTRVETEFEQHRRTTRLLRGSAFFLVAKAADRPFTVHTELAVVEARGTAFGVSIKERDAEVTVEEGTVAVSPRPADASLAPTFAAFDLHKNQQARISSAQAYRVETADVMKTLGWATGIDFVGRPARAAVTEFTRRSGIAIEFDAFASQLTTPISGVYNFNDPVDFAQQVADKTGATLRVYPPGAPMVTVMPQQSP